MKTFTKRFSSVVTGLALMFFVIAACSKKDNNSKPTPPDSPKVTITSLSVNTGIYNTTVIITGTGFSATAANDQVFFNGKLAAINAATTTQLTVAVPLAAGTGSVSLKVDNGTEINGPVFTYQASWVVSTVAGSSTVKGFKDGVGAAASFNGPAGIAVDLSGTLFVTDEDNQVIRKITPDGTVTTIAGTGISGSADGKGNVATFFNPGSVAVDNAGNLYIGDYGNNLVRKIDPANNVTTLAGIVRTNGFTNGPGAKATFDGVADVALDDKGNVYVADLVNEAVRKITPGGIVSTFSKIATTPNIHLVFALDFDKNYNLYVANGSSDYEIKMITPSAVMSIIAGNGVSAHVNGQGSKASFTSPRGIAVDLNGNIYVLDANLIRKIDPTGIVTDFAGNEAPGANDGPAATASFKNPAAIVTDKDGNIYVADVGNNLIRKISFQ